MNDRTQGPWAWEERRDQQGKLTATLLVTKHGPVSCNDPVIFALREDWLGKLCPDREAAKQMILAVPEMVDALRKAEAVLAQLQERPEEARDIIRQGYYGHALVRCRNAIAEAARAVPAAPVFTLPGVWEEVEPRFFVRRFDEQGAFIEAQADGTKVRFKAKVSGLMGGVMHAVQQVGKMDVSQDNQEAIEIAVGALEARINEFLAAHC